MIVIGYVFRQRKTANNEGSIKSLAALCWKDRSANLTTGKAEVQHIYFLKWIRESQVLGFVMAFRLSISNAYGLWFQRYP